MTVCIAAICENGKSAVVAADRLRSWVDYGFQLDLEERKVRFLTDQIAFLFTGDGSTAREITARIRPSDKRESVEVIADLAQKACADITLQQIKRNVRFDQTLAALRIKKDNDERETRTKFLDLVMNKIQAHETGFLAIVAGVDSEGARLFLVNDKIRASTNDSGFMAIGSGDQHAMASLIRRPHTKSASLQQTVYNVYEAKRSAEISWAVGPSTDIAIITADSPPLFLDQNAYQLLDTIYQTMHPAALADGDSQAIASLLRGLTKPKKRLPPRV